VAGKSTDWEWNGNILNKTLFLPQSDLLGMSKRNKLQKFAELLTFPNVYENFDPQKPQLTGINGEPVDRKGQWAKAHFGNEQPITLELACGRGEYTLDLAAAYPDRNFIGVDVKGARIWKGASIALERKLDNAAFLRTRIEEIAYFFAPGEIAEIWITFPDPFLRKSKANRRLTAARFLKEYKKILAPDGVLHLKTDEPNLYEFTLESLAEFPGATILYQDDDIYSKPLALPELETKTYYERMHLAEGKTIKYVRWRLD
jgi:tRNA (guanine-N7-)-methyltransferase